MFIEQDLKQATELAKGGNYLEATDLLKRSVSVMAKTKGCSHQSFCKIVPYFQKAGLYSEAESFCTNQLFEAIEESCLISFSQRNYETKQAFVHLYKAMVFDKLRLNAKREKCSDDEERFKSMYAEHYSKYESWFERENSVC